MSNIPDPVKKFLKVRQDYQKYVYQAIITETEKLFANNPQMTKLQHTINQRLKKIEGYDAAAIMAIAFYCPELLNELMPEAQAPKTTEEAQNTLSELRKKYS